MAPGERAARLVLPVRRGEHGLRGCGALLPGVLRGGGAAFGRVVAAAGPGPRRVRLRPERGARAVRAGRVREVRRNGGRAGGAHRRDARAGGGAGAARRGGRGPRRRQEGERACGRRERARRRLFVALLPHMRDVLLERRVRLERLAFGGRLGAELLLETLDRVGAHRVLHARVLLLGLRLVGHSQLALRLQTQAQGGEHIKVARAAPQET